MTEHPARDTLERYIRGVSEDSEVRGVEVHLLDQQCFSCLMALRALMALAELDLRENVRRSLQGDEVPESEKDESFERAFRQGQRRGAVVTAEWLLGAMLLQELVRRTPAARRELIRTTERFQLFGFAEYLAMESREAVFQDLAQAEELAELGVEVAESLDPQVYDSRFTAEQQAFTLACLGNVRRVASDLFGAEKLFHRALILLEHGSKVSPIRAEIGSLLGSLQIDQCRYYEARRALEEARELFHSYELEHQEARVLIKLADVEGFSGEPAKAVELLRGALPFIEATNDARLLLHAHHNLAYWMVDAGDALEALTQFEKSRPLYDRHSSEPAPHRRRRWLEGRIYAALGDAELATAAFEDVRAEAQERELGFEVAMVSLELAQVYLQQGQTERARHLAEEMSPVFRSHELHRHALATVYLFYQAARTETASVGLVQEILRYLRRARNNPYVRFEPSAVLRFGPMADV
jgi:tetratricopeptide (TPR) repeat protein